MAPLPVIFMFCFLPAFIISASIGDETIGRFWQLTDIHWDRNYSRSGNTNSWCHLPNTAANNNNNSVSRDNGYYGNYSCDPPLALLRSAIDYMTQVEARPDFILWTGDNAPHWDEGPRFDYIYSALRIVTGLLVKAFGADVTILPCLGNHDASPPNQFPGADSSQSSNFYQQYLSEAGWDRLLTRKQQETFKQGGYYIHALPKHNLQVAVLNTNLYYQPNSAVSPDHQADPGGQLNWLDRQLNQARRQGQKVIIASHIAPGFFERYPAELYLYQRYNDALLHVLNTNYDVLHSQVYGHAHTDSFRLLTENINGMWQVRSAAMVAPSLTPWVPQAGTNPGVRLYRYSARVPLEYRQYILNLTLANKLASHPSPSLLRSTDAPPDPHSTDAPHTPHSTDALHTPHSTGLPPTPHSTDAPNTPHSANTLLHRSVSVDTPDNRPPVSAWRLLYSTAGDYGLPDLSVESMSALLWRLMTSPTLFAAYFRYNTGAFAANASEAQCSTLCRRRQLCAIVCLDATSLAHCLSAELDEPVDSLLARRLVMPVASRWRSDRVFSLFSPLVAVVALVLIAVLAVTWHKWRRLLAGVRTTQTFDFQRCQYARLATG